LPEEYFLYFEETDFAMRARGHGWRCVVEPQARLRHDLRSWSETPSDVYTYYFVRNQIHFSRRWAPVSEARLLAEIEQFTATWRRRVSEREPARLASFDRLVASAIADGLAGRTGRRDGIEDGRD